MTGLSGKRKAVESPALAKRPAQHNPQGSRRTKRIKEPALPSKRQPSTDRAPLPDDCDGYAPVSYRLRNRTVFVPKNTRKPIAPTTSEPAPQESEFRKEPMCRPSKQTSTCAQLGLDHYNSMNQGSEILDLNQVKGPRNDSCIPVLDCPLSRGGAGREELPRSVDVVATVHDRGPGRRGRDEVSPDRC